MTDATRVMEEFLGEGKGILNIMADKLSKCIGKNTTHGGILLVALVAGLCVQDRLAIIRDAYRETANVGDDAIIDGARVMDNILSAGSGIYSSFREAILEFAEANYLLRDDNLPKMYEHSDIYADVPVNGIAEADVSL